MGHSMGFLERSFISTSTSSLPSLALWAVAILLDLICPMLYIPVRSPQRLMSPLIFFSRSVVMSSEKYLRLMMEATSRAASRFFSSKLPLISMA